MEKIIFDDGAGKQIIDIGIEDYFGNKCYITIFDGNFTGCIAKNKEYNKRKKYLESIGCRNVIPQKYLEVIDFNKENINKIKKYIDVPLYYTEEKWSIWE